MDKRYSVLTATQQHQLRRELVARIAAAPDTPIPAVIRDIRNTLRLTIAEYAKLCAVSPRTLQDIERGVSSPTLDTMEKLLRPMGMRVGAVLAPGRDGRIA